MAAGDNIALTNSKIVTLGTVKETVFNAADSDTANLVQKFIYTPTGRDNKICIGIKNVTGVLAWSIAAGTRVFGSAAKTGTVAANKTGLLQIETGKYMLANGTIEITLTPASGTKLLTDHAASVFVVELQ